MWYEILYGTVDFQVVKELWNGEDLVKFLKFAVCFFVWNTVYRAQYTAYYSWLET